MTTTKREQVWVGLFVIVAAAILIGTVLSASGALKNKGKVHRAFLGTRAA